MKKFLPVFFCGLGSGTIGLFANQLNTVIGCVFFSLGVVLLVSSIILVFKQGKDSK